MTSAGRSGAAPPLPVGAAPPLPVGALPPLPGGVAPPLPVGAVPPLPVVFGFPPLPVVPPLAVPTAPPDEAPGVPPDAPPDELPVLPPDAAPDTPPDDVLVVPPEPAVLFEPPQADSSRAIPRTVVEARIIFMRQSGERVGLSVRTGESTARTERNQPFAGGDGACRDDQNVTSEVDPVTPRSRQKPDANDRTSVPVFGRSGDAIVWEAPLRLVAAAEDVVEKRPAQSVQPARAALCRRATRGDDQAGQLDGRIGVHNQQ